MASLLKKLFCSEFQVSMMARRIFILRHGETLFNVEKRLQGHCNSALTEKGIVQAERAGIALKEYLDGRGYRIHSSSLGRALQTTDIICEQIGHSKSEVVEEPKLKECSLGDWEQKTLASLLKQYPDLLAEKDWYFKAPGGESYDSLRCRLRSWLDNLPENDDIVAVTHGLAGIVLRGLLLKQAYKDVWKLASPQNAFFIVESDSIKRVRCR